MSFVFASQEYKYDVRYLGCVPLAQSNEDVASQAVELLFHKLDSIQKRAIDKAVEVKFGSRLSEASPAYQTVAKKLKKKGNDVTQGEEATLTVGALNITFADPKVAAKYIGVFSREVEFAKTVSRTAIGDMMALVLKCETKFFCHIFTAKAAQGDELSDVIMESRKFGKREHENEVLASTVTKEKIVAKASHADSDTITLGIGFNHKSAVKISASLRANGKFNIQDKMPKTQSMASIKDEDEDSLDGLDEDMFTNPDVLSSANTQKSPTRASASEPVDTVRMNLENFGFGDEDFGFGDLGDFE